MWRYNKMGLHNIFTNLAVAVIWVRCHMTLNNQVTCFNKVGVVIVKAGA